MQLKYITLRLFTIQYTAFSVIFYDEKVVHEKGFANDQIGNFQLHSLYKAFFLVIMSSSLKT